MGEIFHDLKGKAENGKDYLPYLQETPGSWAASVVHLVTGLRSLAQDRKEGMTG